MNPFNEENVTENMCIEVAQQAGLRKMLRTILWLKYKIKDNDVFEKAYKYVEMYY
jgi:type I restriction enzyme R subunit